jgi:hypothetical protein
MTDTKLTERLAFKYQRKTFEYFSHPYNTARLNERAVEVPVALAFLRGYEAVALEVGAVLPHYLDWDAPGYARHTVIDLYEPFPGVAPQDVLTWEPEGRYERILSISTLEHLGTRERFVKAVARLQGWVIKGGRLLVTVPAGWDNARWLTPSLLSALDMSVRRYDKTDIQAHLWSEVVPHTRFPPRRYGFPARWANTVYLLEYQS